MASYALVSIKCVVKGHQEYRFDVEYKKRTIQRFEKKKGEKGCAFRVVNVTGCYSPNSAYHITKTFSSLDVCIVLLQYACNF